MERGGRGSLGPCCCCTLLLSHPSQQSQGSMRNRHKKLKKSLLLFPLEFGPFLEASPNANSESKLSHVAVSRAPKHRAY